MTLYPRVVNTNPTTGGKHQPDHTGKHQPDHAGKHQPDHAGKHQPDHAGKHRPAIDKNCSRYCSQPIFIIANFIFTA